MRLHRRSVLPAIGLAVRGAALFLAAFTAVGLVGELRGRTLDVSLWWVDLRDLPSLVRVPMLAAFSMLLAGWAILPAAGPLRRLATMAASATLAAFAIRDVVGYYAVVGAGEIRPFVDLPLSLLIALVLAGITAGVAVGMGGAVGTAGSPRARGERAVGAAREAVGLLVSAGVWAVLFPLAQMLFFGTTDYRAAADAAVVFGAGVYADGQPSPLLADRIATGIGLYREGLVPLLVMSGGDGATGFNEARVMGAVAVAAGVDPSAVIVDPAGDSTEATVANVASLLGAGGRPLSSMRVIAVSQAYHLPRVQLAFAAAGIDVLTVPAADPAFIGEMPILIVREVLAFWAYDLRVCLG